jgi:thiamine-phosphate pyrophosphorylase
MIEELPKQATMLPRLYPILDTQLLARRNCPILLAAEAMLEGGARILQFRHKGNYGRVVFEEARGVAELCHRRGVLFLIDDRADIAVTLNAGVHVGQDDLPASDARRIVGPARLVGLSTHNLEQFTAALSEPIDYLAYGPVFPTASKQNPDAVVGLGGIAAIVGRKRRPTVAIGGITRQNAAAVLASGADSVAVIADLLPEELTYTALRTRMEEWQRLVKN